MTRTLEQCNLAHRVADWAESGNHSAVSYDQQFCITTRGRTIPVREMREGQCNTSACIAGYTAILTAPEGAVTDGGWLWPDGTQSDDTALDIHDFAAEQFGLTEAQSDMVFLESGSRTAPKLLRWLADNPGATDSETVEKLKKLEAEAERVRKLSDKLFSWASILEPEAEQQALRISRMSFVQPYMAAMPDIHAGKGAPVGSVIPTVGALAPAWVGVDIGCGMIAVRTQFFAVREVHHGNPGWSILGERGNPVHRDLASLRKAIEAAIPSSMGRYNSHVSDTASARAEELDHMPGADSAYRVAPNWPTQLGSLGGGNHFIEVTRDETGRVWLFLHSGSRGVGNRLAMHHIKVARDICKLYAIKLEDPDNAYLAEGSLNFGKYLTDLRWAQRFAYLNREEMMNRLILAFGAWAGEDVVPSEIVNCHHNYTEKVDDRGTQFWLTRKGAIDATAGKPGLIPGSMGTASYVVTGLGNPEAFWSAPHGAGRVLSRGQAKRTLSFDKLAEQMSGIEWSRNRAFLDEAVDAYKDIDVVMQDAEDLVKIEHTLHQIVNVKGV